MHCTVIHCIYTRGGIYRQILPEPEGNTKGESRGISQGLMLYFTVYPNSSHKTDILNYNSIIVPPGRAILEELILHIALAAGTVCSTILPALLGVYWKYSLSSTGSIFNSTLPVELDQY